MSGEVVNLHPANPGGKPQRVPASLEAEHALLGCVLYDNSALEHIDDGFAADSFYEPLHARIFRAIEGLHRKGQLAEPIGIAEQFRFDAAFEEFGGVAFLAQLIDFAPPANQAKDFARLIADMALRRQVLGISQDAVREVTEDLETSGRDHVEAIEQRLFALAEHRASAGVVAFGDALAGAVEMASQAFSRDGGLSGLSTGFLDLDKKLGGLHPSDLIILAARPSMGKTSLATNIAQNVARAYRFEADGKGGRRTIAGGNVLFFSLEMSAEQLAHRVLAAEAGISGDRLRKGDIDQSEYHRIRDAAVTIDGLPLFIDATGGITIAKLVQRARRQKRLTGLDLIVVDYLQLVTTGAGYKADNRVQEVSMITQGLKALAKDLNIPVIALSQLSRAVEQREDKKPQLSDLRESGSIEQDADMVIFLYREEYYLKRNEPDPMSLEAEEWRIKCDACKGKAEAIIGKQRHGPIGTVHLAFNEDLTLFGNLAREEHIRFAGY